MLQKSAHAHTKKIDFFPRLVIVSTASAIAVVVAVSLSDVTTFAVVMALFGFLLSHDPFSHLKALLCLLSLKRSNRIARFLHSLFRRGLAKKFVSHRLGDVRPLTDWTGYLFHLFLSSLKECVSLAGALVCVYFTSRVEDEDNGRLLATIFSGVTIALCLFVFVSDGLQQPYLLGLVRNWLYPRAGGGGGGQMQGYKPCRQRLHYASIPRKVVICFSEL